MIRHIILWKFSDQVRKAGNGDEVIEMLRASAAGMLGKIDGLLSVELARNTAGNEYDFIYCAEFIDQKSLDAYQTHPLHEAHKKRSKPYVNGRLVVDYLR